MQVSGLLLLFLSVHLETCSASIEVNVLGDGTATLVCTAQQVVYMQWSISLTDTDIIVDFDTITRSLTEAITIVEGVTLLSALVTIQSLYQIQSVIAVSPSFDGVGKITFICSGNTPSSTFENIVTITRPRSDFEWSRPTSLTGRPTISNDMTSVTTPHITGSESITSPHTTSLPDNRPSDLKPTGAGSHNTSMTEDTTTENDSDTAQLAIVLSLVSLAAVLIAMMVITLLVVYCYLVSKHKTSTKNHDEHSYDYPHPIHTIPITHTTPTTSHSQQLGITHGQRHDKEFVSMTQNVAYDPVIRRQLNEDEENLYYY